MPHFACQNPACANACGGNHSGGCIDFNNGLFGASHGQCRKCNRPPLGAALAGAAAAVLADATHGGGHGRGHHYSCGKCNYAYCQDCCFK